jgi:A/G-specific adenine glycosylase
MKNAVYAFFRKELMKWFEASHRPLPWKGERDPYLIWLAEIILQQTRVEQGLPYYERFKARYPQVQALAEAPPDEVMKLWEGLGYYSRARNLQQTAQYVTLELGGKFPRDYEGLRRLKGVGEYTAAAIASFAYGLPHAVLDGNVFRVLARFFGISTPIDSSAGKRQFSELAQVLIAGQDPAQHNQAMMDFGATHCTPKAPACSTCPLRPACQAFQQEKVDKWPVKAKKLQRKARYFHYLVFNQAGYVWLQKRAASDIWQQLYEFPLLEFDRLTCVPDELRASTLWQKLLGKQEAHFRQSSPPFSQVLTHQKIHAIFWEIELPPGTTIESEGLKPEKRENLPKFAFPKIIAQYLKDNSLYLGLL